jgi:hypothetical protein
MSDVIFMPLLAACIQFKYFSFHYTTESTLLTFQGPIHRGKREGTISYFMQGLASRLGFPHCQDTGQALELLCSWQGWDRE